MYNEINGGGLITLEINGITVNYEDGGTGETILILEGWATNTELYSGLFTHLVRTHRVLLPDLPGFGKTPPPPQAWDCSDYVRFVKSFLAKLNIEKVILIGHSHGGRIIIKLLAELELEFSVPKIVLIDSAGIVHKRTLRQLASLGLYKAGRHLLSLAPVRLLFPGALEALRRKRGSEDYRNAIPVMRETLVKLVNEDMKVYMPGIKQPSLLIWGDKDTATPIHDAHIMEKLIPGAGLVTVPGAGHYSYLERPDFVFRVLDSFLGADST